MRRKYAAVAMYEGELGIRHLAAVGFLAKLAYGLDDVEQAAGRA